MILDSKRPPAVILGLGHPRQTAYLKSLSRSGVPVHALHTERSVYTSSRRLSSFHLLDEDPQSQLGYVENLGAQLGRGFLVPTNDDNVALVAQNLERLSKHFLIPLPDWEVIGGIFDRATCYAKASAAGIKVPRYWVPTSDAGLKDVVAALRPANSDYIIKTPSILSAPANEAAIRLTKAAPKQHGDILTSCQELKGRIGVYPMIQEVIPGAADSAVGVTMIVSKTGDIVLAYCVRRLRLASYRIDAGYVHPYELGSVVWCETTHDDEAVEAARELVRAFRYFGQITVEFRRDSRDGSLHLMKVEPRPVRATSLSSAIGMDIPTILYRVFLGENVQVPREYPDGVGWLWTMAYGQSLFYNQHRNRRDMLRVLRGLNRIKAYAEDYGDPVPLIQWAAGRVVRPVRELLTKDAPRQSLSEA
jgi:predicted ATP-grasp superfamily ATP-dependent carboligase